MFADYLFSLFLSATLSLKIVRGLAVTNASKNDRSWCAMLCSHFAVRVRQCDKDFLRNDVTYNLEQCTIFITKPI